MNRVLFHPVLTVVINYDIKLYKRIRESKNLIHI